MQIKLDGGTLLSDNSKELSQPSASSIFVKTKLNARYQSEINKEIKVISPAELKDYLNLNIKVVGVTGTNGKTTISHLIAFLLESLGFKVALLGTRGFFINGRIIKDKGLTTPSLLEIYANMHLAAKEGCQYFIMEVSSHALDQNRIEGIDFRLKVLSNIASDHLNYHPSQEAYEQTKLSFFKDEGSKLLNADLRGIHFNPVNAYTYGIEHRASLGVSAYGAKDSISAHIIWQNLHKIREGIKEEGVFSSPLVGKFNLYNLLAGIASVKILENIPISKICELVFNFNGVPGRMEIISYDPLIIVDFAHTADGMKNVFESFMGRKLVVVFGAGGDRDKQKRPLMGAMASKYASRIYLTSDNPRSEDPNAIIEEIKEGMSPNVVLHIDPSRKNAIKQAMRDLKHDEVLLILGRGDESVQIVGDENIDFDDRIEVRSNLVGN